MLGIRYALMYPAEVEQLVLVDPIGLEDWKAKGVPWQSVDAWYRAGAARPTPTASAPTSAPPTTPAPGSRNTRAGCRCWPGCTAGPGREAVAWNSALLYDMIYTQPVVYEFGHLSMPVLLMIGDKDTTAIGKDAGPARVRATLGDYPALGKALPRDPARPAGRVPRAGPRAADPGARPLPRGPAGRIASPTAAVNSPRQYRLVHGSCRAITPLTCSPFSGSRIAGKFQF